LFTFPKNYVPPSHCLFTLPKHYGPPIQCLFTKQKLFFPPFHFHFPCYCFGFVIENGGCWKEGHKAADLGILAWRFSNENEGDRHLEQNKDTFDVLKKMACHSSEIQRSDPLSLVLLEDVKHKDNSLVVRNYLMENYPVVDTFKHQNFILI
jgi:hypothetical protein